MIVHQKIQQLPNLLTQAHQKKKIVRAVLHSFHAEVVRDLLLPKPQPIFFCPNLSLLYITTATSNPILKR
jgi:hypothetical protein